MKELVRLSEAKLEQGYRAEIQANNERVEERIDDVLVQIQGIVSGLEDSLYTRIGKIEDDMALVSQEVDHLREHKVDKTQEEEMKKLAQQALFMARKVGERHESLQEVVAECSTRQAALVEKATLADELTQLKRELEGKIEVAVAESRAGVEDGIGEAQLKLIEVKMRELQEAMDSEQELLHEQRVKEQEERLSQFQAEFS